MSSPLMITDEQSIRQAREFFETYNKFTEMCFGSCVYTLNSRSLTPEEKQCVTSCVSKRMAANHKVMSVFVVGQQLRQAQQLAELRAAATDTQTAPALQQAAQQMLSQSEQKQ